MYDVPMLLEMCTEFVERNLHSDNIVEFAELGVLYEDRCSILKKCLICISNCVFFNAAKFSLLGASHVLVQKVIQFAERKDKLTEDLLFEKVSYIVLLSSIKIFFSYLIGVATNAPPVVLK